MLEQTYLDVAKGIKMYLGSPILENSLATLGADSSVSACEVEHHHINCVFSRLDWMKIFKIDFNLYLLYLHIC